MLAKTGYPILDITDDMTKSSAQYHTMTSYRRHEMAGHYLDWQNQPMVYKDYPGITPILLPTQVQFPEEKLSSLLSAKDTDEKVKVIDSEILSLILRLTYSLTARARHPGGDFYFRSVASAGALYPAEIYVSTHGAKGLEDGLYHFAIHRSVLFPLRKKDLSHSIAAVTQTPEDKAPILSFFLTSIFFRSAWKYRERSYRYHLLDTGHLVENLILALKALRLPFRLSYDFDDEKVNHLLGLDEAKEVALAVAHVPGDETVSELTEQELAPLPERMRNASQVAGREVDYPLIREIHSAGSTVISKSKSRMLDELGVTPERWTKITRPSAWPEVMSYSEAVFNRRSRRNFIKEPIRKDCWMALLGGLHRDHDVGSTRETSYHQAVCSGVLMGRAEGISPGFYLIDPMRESMGLVNSGHYIEPMAQICLDQAWLTNAAIHFLFLANPDVLDQTWGARGYRYAMMSAGRMGERLYLAATSMGIGCCGIGAFYDGEAAELLGLSKASNLLYLVALGPVKSIKSAS